MFMMNLKKISPVTAMITDSTNKHAANKYCCKHVIRDKNKSLNQRNQRRVSNYQTCCHKLPTMSLKMVFSYACLEYKMCSLQIVNTLRIS